MVPPCGFDGFDLEDGNEKSVDLRLANAIVLFTRFDDLSECYPETLPMIPPIR